MGEKEIRAFLLHLVDKKGASPTVCGVHVWALKFLYRVTLNRPEEVDRITGPKRAKTLPDVLTIEDVQAIFKTVRSIKYCAILATAYGAGLRISEVCSLQIEDIDSKRMLIHIRSGKGKKDRFVQLSPRLLSLLREYFRLVRPAGPYLFEGQKPGSHLSTTAVSVVMKKIVRELGLPQNVSMHTLRHSFATHLLETGHDLSLIQKVLGHASLLTTAHYAKVTDKLMGDLRNPLDQIDLPVDQPAP
jgi:site-specific recombinase XerD